MFSVRNLICGVLKLCVDDRYCNGKVESLDLYPLYVCVCNVSIFFLGYVFFSSYSYHHRHLFFCTVV